MDKEKINKPKTRMELSSNRHSIDLAHTDYITYTGKMMNDPETKYHRDVDIVSATTCNNTDKNLYLPRWKCLCRFLQQ